MMVCGGCFLKRDAYMGQHQCLAAIIGGWIEKTMNANVNDVQCPDDQRRREFLSQIYQQQMAK